MHLSLKFVTAVGLFLIAASAQTAMTPSTRDGAFQIKIFSNLGFGDSIINIGNTGASSTGISSGNLCVNIYVFAPDEQEIACCTCVITPNAVQTVSVRMLESRPLTPAVPTALTVKLLSTPAPGGTCNAATPGSPAPGLLAFGTTIHAATPGGSTLPGTYAVTETPFVPSTLSAAEFSRITTLCGFIQANGTGFGQCPGCTLGAGGAERQ